MRRSFLAVLLLVAGCAYGAPAVSPSPAGPLPSAPPTAAPTATAGPTVAPTTPGSSAGSSCDPDMGYGCRTPAPSDGATAAPSPQGSVIVITRSTGAEPHFLGPSGNALYTFDNDSPGQSACGSGCTDNWPPLIVAQGTSVQAGGDEANFGTLTRTDGSLQLTYDQKPLYYFSGDASASDTNGDGLFGVWHLAHP